MSLRMGSHQGSSRANALDKRVPRNPRYADIQSKVKTGMTVDKVTFVTTRQHLRRQEEPYFRLTPSQLSELLSEYEQDRQEGVQDFRDHIDPDHHGPKVVEHDADARPRYERPYLILDVREPTEYSRCHITQARSFEAKLLNQDRMTQELYTYKNKEGGLVVLYSNDDREACHAARTLIHRGFDNVFVLSGGVVAFARHTHSFVEGDVAALPTVTVPAGGSSGSSSGGTTNHGNVPSTRGRRSSTDGSANKGRGVYGEGSCSSVDGSMRSSAATGGGRGGRLDYRGEGGQTVVLRNGFPSGSRGNRGRGNGSGGGGNGMTHAGHPTRGPEVLRRGIVSSSRNGTISADFAGVGRCVSGRKSSDGRSREDGVGGPVHARRPKCGVFSAAPVAGDGRGDVSANLRGGEGLVEAAAAASAARRRSVGKQGGDASRDSAVTVADSVISRATARRGRW